MQTWFRPELLNRFDEIISFNKLSRESLRDILQNMLRDLCASIKNEQCATLEFTEEAEKFMAEKAYNPSYGARELGRVVEHHLSIPLSRLILSGKMTRQSVWEVLVRNDAIHLSKKESDDDAVDL